MDTFKVIIAGGRDFNDPQQLRRSCDFHLQDIEPGILEFVSGGAKGADYWGEQYAIFRGYIPTIFKADWDQFGKAAGPIRNRAMARYAKTGSSLGGMLIAFWDRKSRGTHNMIREAKIKGLTVHVVYY